MLCIRKKERDKLDKNITEVAKDTKNKEYSAFLISAYIINSSINSTKEFTNIGCRKLQAILFVLQLCYIETFGKKLFFENFITWQTGPTIKSVYHQFKSDYQHKIDEYHVYDEDCKYIKTLKYNDDLIKAEDKEFIKSVTDELINFSREFLMDVALNHELFKCTYNPLEERRIIFKKGINNEKI